MAIISFAKTTDEFLAGIKTCTRRDWSARQTRMWQKFWDDGKLVHTAYGKSPRAKGKPMGQFRLTCRPYLEALQDMPWKDLDAEGGMCKNLVEYFKFIGMERWQLVTVIRFERIAE